MSIGAQSPDRVDVTLLPASSMQRRLWLLEQLHPGHSFGIPMVGRVDGRLDKSALRTALTAISARHEALRTGLRTVDDELRQVIFDPGDAPIPLRTTDVRELPADLRADAVRRYTAEQTELPFDLAQAPLLRAHLVTVTENEQVLLLTAHHAVCDGASIDILFGELFDHYRRAVRGEYVAGEPAPMHFGDWVEWQQERQAGERMRRQRDYWTDRLAGAPPLLELPTDRERARTASFDGGLHRFELAGEALVRLRALARANGVSTFVTLLAGMAAVLHRYSGQANLCIGTPVSVRDRPELDGVIGPLLNTVVLRIGVDRDPTLRELLKHTAAVVAGAVANQDLPFEDVVEAVGPPRDPGSTPLYQVLFTLEQGSRRSWRVPGALVRVQTSSHRTARNDLAISWEETADRLYCDIEYRADLFGHDRIVRLAGHYLTLLDAAAADPGRRLSALPMLTGPERRQVLVEWNDTRRDFPRDSSAADLFAEQVALRPDAVALYAESGELTYQELDRYATALAYRLHALGAGPDVVVGVCLPRSAWLVVALLGVLKAGAAYLALDTRQPADRLSFMLRDCGTPVLVTQRDFAALAVECGIEPVFVGTQPEPAAEGGPLPGARGENLAYVLYTSGSTGRPNGVAVPHRALARLVKNIDYCDLGPQEVHLQMSAVSFDASLIELWGPLLNGGAVAVPPTDRPFLDQLREGFARYPVTHLLLISPQLPLALDEHPELLGRLGQLLVGGDVMSPRHAKETLHRHPGLRLHHVYGPTECTLFATECTLREVDDGKPTVPIGRPITNTGAYVLDPYLRPQPVGVPGELYLTGDGLARGYLGRPGLTATRFVADPHGAPGDRMYHTGDLARWCADGNLEFLGRTDHQVKIRGHRIELGEIETVLAEHPAVADTAVVADPDLPGGAGLIGYVALAATGSTSMDELRDHAARRLPEYMAPVAIVELDGLPLTPHGKLDRRALPRVMIEESGAGQAHRTDTERRVAGIWLEVLEVARVGREQNFFAIGGSSLGLMALHQRLDRAWPGAIRLAELFELSTVAAQAATIDRWRGVRTGDDRTNDDGVCGFEL